MKRINKLNPFKKNLYAEFESNSFKLMGVPSSRVREVLGERGHDLNADLKWHTLLLVRPYAPGNELCFVFPGTSLL